MDCQKAKELIPSYLAPQEPWDNPADKADLMAHIAMCESCRHEYEASRKIVRLFQKYGQVSEETRALVRKARRHALEQQQSSPTSEGIDNTQEAWRDFCERCPDFQDMPSGGNLSAEPSSLQVLASQSHDMVAKCASRPKAPLRWATGTAACLLIGLLTWSILGHLRGLEPPEPVNLSPMAASSSEAPAIKLSCFPMAAVE